MIRVLPGEDGQVPPPERCGGSDPPRTVVGMTAFHDVAPLVAGSHWDHGGFWWFPLGVLWLAVLATAIWLAVRALRHRTPSALERAQDILAERYARGELTSEEYRERLDQLRGDSR
jgi:putative membrane protein